MRSVFRQPSTDCGLSEPEKSAVDANRLPFGSRGKTKKIAGIGKDTRESLGTYESYQPYIKLKTVPHNIGGIVAPTIGSFVGLDALGRNINLATRSVIVECVPYR